jgi:uncharacterized protein
VPRLHLLLLAALALPLSAFDVPRLTGPVVDRAGMLSSAAERQIAGALRKLHQEAGGAQIAVLTVPDLGGETIEQASIQVADAWQLGSEAKDDGVLLMIAKAERRIRIEVGQGLEGDLPDAWAKRIIDESMTPLFRSGNVDQGILVGVYQIAQRVHPDLDVAPLFQGAQRRDWQTSHRDQRGLGALLPILFLLLLLWGGRGRGGGLLGGILLGTMLGGGRGRYGGGGFGGGGFGGGGGGFSGGGASGGW